MTTIDPTDNMTFWTVGEYYANTSAFNWHTRIGKFNFRRRRPKPNAHTDRYTGFLQLGGWTNYAKPRNPHGGCLFPS